jgi:cbb3-type cytochrome oxidase subunit 3
MMSFIYELPIFLLHTAVVLFFWLSLAGVMYFVLWEGIKGYIQRMREVNKEEHLSDPEDWAGGK